MATTKTESHKTESLKTEAIRPHYRFRSTSRKTLQRQGRSDDGQPIPGLHSDGIHREVVKPTPPSDRHNPVDPAKVEIYSLADFLSNGGPAGVSAVYGATESCGHPQQQSQVRRVQREIWDYLPLVASWIMVMGSGLFYAGIPTLN